MSATTCIGAQVASEAGEILDMAGIFYVLFGWLQVALIAEDHGFGEADLVVRTRDLTKAIETLIEAGFRQCQDPNCLELQVARRPLTDTGDGVCFWREVFAADVLNCHHAVANAHFHLESQYESCTVLSLYTTSDLFLDYLESGELPANDTLWFSNDPRLPPYKDPSLILYEDPRLPPCEQKGPSGPWTDLYPVRIMSPVAFSEALIILVCQSFGHIDFVDAAWINMWERVVFKKQPRTLSPRFQPIWDIFNADEPDCNPYDVLRALRADMIANNEFRYLPPVEPGRL